MVAGEFGLIPTGTVAAGSLQHRVAAELIRNALVIGLAAARIGQIHVGISCPVTLSTSSGKVVILSTRRIWWRCWWCCCRGCCRCRCRRFGTGSALGGVTRTGGATAPRFRIGTRPFSGLLLLDSGTQRPLTPFVPIAIDWISGFVFDLSWSSTI